MTKEQYRINNKCAIEAASQAMKGYDTCYGKRFCNERKCHNFHQCLVRKIHVRAENIVKADREAARIEGLERDNKDLKWANNKKDIQIEAQRVQIENMKKVIHEKKTQPIAVVITLD